MLPRQRSQLFKNERPVKLRLLAALFFSRQPQYAVTPEPQSR